MRRRATDETTRGIAPIHRSSIGRFARQRSESSDATVARSVDEAEQPESAPQWQDRTMDFSVGMKAHVGEKLRLTRGALVSRGGQRVASISLFGWGTAAEMVCADGAWCLKKRRKYGWELIIESGDGRHVGWYSGRRLLPGGTISLISGARVDLRRSFYGGWKLRVSGTRQRIADIRGYEWCGRWLTIASIPAEIYTEAEVVVLTACAVLFLLDSIRAPVASGGGG